MIGLQVDLDGHDLAQQRLLLVAQCRVWAIYFRRVDGDGARAFPADVIANELEACGLGEIRRVGDRLQRIVHNWLLDEDAAGSGAQH